MKKARLARVWGFIIIENNKLIFEREDGRSFKVSLDKSIDFNLKEFLWSPVELRAKIEGKEIIILSIYKLDQGSGEFDFEIEDLNLEKLVREHSYSASSEYVA